MLACMEEMAKTIQENGVESGNLLSGRGKPFLTLYRACNAATKQENAP